MSGRPRNSLVERIAMELRQIESEEACELSGNRYTRSAAETWNGAAEILRDGYRTDARRLVRLMRAHRGEPE